MEVKNFSKNLDFDFLEIINTRYNRNKLDKKVSIIK